MQQSGSYREMRFQKKIKKLAPKSIWFRSFDPSRESTVCCRLSAVCCRLSAIGCLLDVPKGIAYNNALFCDSVMPDLVESICAHSRRRILKCIMVDLDNAHFHKSRKSIEYLEQFRVRRVPCLDYSSDLVPSGFFLLGHIRSKLPGLAIWSREGLICEIRHIFEEIPKVTLIFVYTSWIKRFKWMSKNDGDYFH
jgi:hypothetical protein